MGWIILALVMLLACIILYASDQPGQRRRRRDPGYSGPERRNDDSPSTDFFQHPAFRPTRCANCDKLKRKACPPSGEGCDPDIPEVYRENNERHI